MYNNYSSNKIRPQTIKVALMGLLFALAMTFSWLESMVIIPGLPPGIKLGLSNIITMYCLFCLGNKEAYILAFMKAAFVLITRGPVAGAMSLAGGICSVTAMLVLIFLSKRCPLGYISLSVIGAVFHNIGQLIMARLITNVFLYYYIPVLLLAGATVGIITGMTFQWILPYIPKKFIARKLILKSN